MIIFTHKTLMQGKNKKFGEKNKKIYFIIQGDQFILKKKIKQRFIVRLIYGIYMKINIDIIINHSAFRSDKSESPSKFGNSILNKYDKLWLCPAVFNSLI